MTPSLETFWQDLKPFFLFRKAFNYELAFVMRCILIAVNQDACSVLTFHHFKLCVFNIVLIELNGFMVLSLLATFSPLKKGGVKIMIMIMINNRCGVNLELSL